MGQLGRQDVPDHLYGHLLTACLLTHPQGPAKSTASPSALEGAPGPAAGETHRDVSWGLPQEPPALGERWVRGDAAGAPNGIAGHVCPSEKRKTVLENLVCPRS